MIKRIALWCLVLSAMVLLGLPRVGVTTAQQSQRPEYVMVYVPLEWDASMSEFQQLCERHTRWFLDMSGIERYADVRVEYVGEIMRRSNLTNDDLDFQVMRFGAKRVTGDIYIGLTYQDVGDDRVAGWTHFFGQGIVGEIEQPRLVAHELGHTFGLCDEYYFSEWSRQNEELKSGCPNPFPGTCERDLDAVDYCTGTAVGGGYCIMGVSHARETYCHFCAEHLAIQFEELFGEPQVPATPTQVAVFTPRPTSTPTPPGTAEPTPTGRPTLPPPPATSTWPATPTLQPGVPTNTPQPPATAMPSRTPSPQAYQVTFLSEQGGLFHLVRLDEQRRSLQQIYSSAAAIYQPATSPDGTKIAFVLAGADDWDIYLLETESGEVRQMTDHPARDEHPAWLSNDRLTFVSDRESGYGIYEISTMDQPPRLLLSLAEDEYGPAFSSLGDRVAVLANTPEGYAVRIYSLATTASQPLTLGPGIASSISWAPDGTQFLLSVAGPERARLLKVTMDGAHIDLAGESFNAANGAWTPHSDEIVFASDAGGDWEIYRMQLETGQVQPLTRNGYPDLYPMVSQ